MSEDYFNCRICHRKLLATCFNKDRSNCRGFHWECRECSKKLRRTPPHLAAMKWTAMKWRVRSKSQYAHVEIRITREEFIAWAVPLLKAWDWRLGSPSVDRIDPKGHYELSNMQIISRNENSSKDKKSRTAPAGTKWCPDCNEYRTFSEFYKDRSSAFGLESHCRDHKNARQQRRRLKLR